jgi:uncharacterized membrane protein YphA (DoxX/SURF4 family)
MLQQLRRTIMTLQTRNIDRALLVLRLAVGVTFFAHGWMKLFVMGRRVFRASSRNSAFLSR